MTEFLLNFHFLRPWWLLAALPAAALCFALLKKQRSANQWGKYINPQLLHHLLDQQQVRESRWPVFALLGLWLVATLAIAGPTWRQLPQPVEQSSDALVIGWDLSPSMLAQDIQPSRLERARLKIIDLLKSRSDGQFALVAYSGEAYTVTPLTDDIQTIVNLLPALSPTYLPTVGSNPEMAFDTAEQLLKDAGQSSGNIVLLTDGIAEGAMGYLQDAARDSPYQLTIWAIGTEEGAPIPLPNGGFAKTASGEMVVPKLDETALQDFASQAGAWFVPAVTNDTDIQTLNQLLQPATKQTVKTERMFDQWFEHGQYFALILLPFVALIFRKGWLFCLLLMPGALLYSPGSYALDWQDLWQTQDQQAEARLERGDDSASLEFTTPARRGSALYEQGNFTEAAKQFSQNEDAVAHFNKGTALTKAGEYEKAIAAFDQALQQDSDFAEAQKNRAIAEKLAQMQKQQEQQQQQQQNQQNDQGDNSDGEQGEQGSDQSDGGDPQQEDGSKGEQNQQQSGSEGNKQHDGESSQNDEAGTPPEQQNGQGEQEEPGENPYSNAEPEPEEASEQEADQAQASATEGEEQAPEQQEATALTGMREGEKTEAQEQLEVMLRKVPDDPGGLLREKFRYQYHERKRDPTQTMKNNEAENRW